MTISSGFPPCLPDFSRSHIRQGIHVSINATKMYIHVQSNTIMYTCAKQFYLSLNEGNMVERMNLNIKLYNNAIFLNIGMVQISKKNQYYIQITYLNRKLLPANTINIDPKIESEIEDKAISLNTSTIIVIKNLSQCDTCEAVPIYLKYW